MKRSLSLRVTVVAACAALLFILGAPCADAQTPLTINNDIQTYSALANTAVTMAGVSQLRITGTSSPIAGSTVNLTSADAWFFMTNIRPSVVSSTYLSQIKVNGAAAVLDTNCRIVQYGDGAVVIPQASSYAAMTVYSGPLFTGTSKTLTCYTAYATSTLGTLNDNISSFKLKRGYTATIAQNDAGTGVSKNYVAADGDLEVALLPADLNKSVSFIRVFPWRWASKKGISGNPGNSLLNLRWWYDWNIDQTSTLDLEYTPIRAQQYWPSLTQNWKTLGANQLLGYNEPDQAAQANLAVAAAISSWPDLLSTGLRAGAPAVSDGGKVWLYSFVSQADAAGLRVDFIPIHYYQCHNPADPAGAATQMYNFLLDVWNTTHRPIWVTEWNNGANWTTCADPTAAQQQACVAAMQNMLETTPFVERYALYNWVEDVRAVVLNSALTAAGTTYRDKVSSLGYTQVIPEAPTPVGALYHFEGDARDSSGNGHAAILAGAAKFAAGKTGQSVVLSGVSANGDCVELSPRLGDSTDFTFGAWVYWNGGSNWQRIFDLGNGTATYMFLTPSSSTGTMRFAINNGSGEQQLNHTAALPTNTWTHVAVTISGNTGKLFINGVLKVTNTGMTINPVDLGTTTNFLGKSQFAADPLFAGQLDEVQFLPSALTDAQVAKMLTNTPPQFTSSAVSGGTATQATAYTGTVAGKATDADSGDTLTYSKVSGPAWLTVAASGALTGTPTVDDAGTEEFLIQATDSAGATTLAVLTITLPVATRNGTWTSDADGIWSDAAKWSGGLSAYGSGYAADFSTLNVSTDRAVTLDKSRTVGTLKFGDTSGTQSWTLKSSGGSTLTLDTGSASPSIVVNQNTATITTALAGTLGFTKTGAGTLVMAGDNSLSGPIVVGGTSASTANDGTLRISNPDAVAAVDSITLLNNNTGTSTLELDGSSENFAMLTPVIFSGRSNPAVAIRNLAGNNTLSGDVSIGSGGGNYLIESAAGTLTLGGAVTSLVTGTRTVTLQGAGNGVAGGNITNGSATSVAITKAGAGTWTLGGANTYTGATTLSAGTLVVNGSIASGGTLTTAAGTILTGSGTIGAAATINGTHNPGVGVGTQTFTGALNYGATGRLSWVLVGNTFAPGSFDGVAAGAVTIANGASLDLVFNSTASFVNFADVFWKYGHTWTVLTGTSVSGSFALGNISTDAGGLAVSSYGAFAIQQSGTAVTLAFTPIGGALAPQQPQGLSTTYGDSQAVLTWTAAAGADSYTILRSTSRGGPYTAIASGLTTLTYTDATAANGTTYYYEVVAANSAGASPASVVVNATPHALVPYPADAYTLVLFHLDETGSAAANTGTLGGNGYSVNMTTASATPPVVTTVLGANGTNALGKAATFASGQLIGWDYNKSGAYQGDINGTLSADRLAMSALNMGNGGQTPWTIEAMIYCNLAAPNANQEILCTDSSAASRGFQFRINASGQLELNLIANSTDITAAIPTTGAHAYAARKWIHAAATYDGNSIKLYWTRSDSGVTSANLLSTTAASVGTSFGAVTGPLCIGGENRDANGEYFQGRIDEVRISKVARPATGMQPAYIDSDGDGLPDEWERLYFGALTYGAGDDPDQDGYSNALELAAGTDPTDPSSNPSGTDLDGDGLPDVWEQAYFGSLNYGPYDDPDSDGYSNIAELIAGTDPTSAASHPSWRSPRVAAVQDTVLTSAACLMPTSAPYGRAINGVSFQKQILQTFNGYQYTAWYDTNAAGTTQTVWLARRSVSGTTTGAWQAFNTGSTFVNGKSAWDAHNVIAFGICPADGTLHLAWDHHGNTLRYRRSIAALCTTNTAAWGTAGMLNAEQNWLTASGTPVTVLTYPQFIVTPAGALMLDYRYGSSGDGDQMWRSYNPISGAAGGNWTDQTLFMSRTGTYQGSTSRCAYINGYDFGPDGKIHVSWTWREGAGTSNHDICYAYSADGGVTWANNAGVRIADTSLGQSINLDSPGIIIKALDSNQLLINQQAQTVDQDGRVHVLMLHRREDPGYAYPNITTATYSTVGTAYYHYFRDPTSGQWSQRRIPVDAYPVGSRPKIVYDASGNLYAVFVSYSGTSVVTPGYSSGKLVVASASKASQYTDWEVVQVNNTTFNGEPIIDQARLLSDNILSVYIQEDSATTAVVGTPLHVLDYTVGNVPPTLAAVADQTLPFNTASGPIALTVGDSDTPLGSLTLSASAANPSLIPAANVVFSGTGAARTAVITPAANASGTTAMTIVVSDGAATASQTFNVTVLTQSQTWRQANFGANWNNAAISGDAVDPDNDGLSNLLEYALGTDPNTASTSVSQGVVSNGRLTISFTRNTAASDLTLSVLAADDLAGPWSEIARSAAGAVFSASVSGATINESGTGATRAVQVGDVYLANDPAHPKRFLKVQATR